MTETVAEITDPKFRSGTGSKGEWTLAKIVTDKGNSATAFQPIAVGDEVELIYNAQYKNYSAKKTAKSKPTQPSEQPPGGPNASFTKSNPQLDRIEQKLDKLLAAILAREDEF